MMLKVVSGTKSMAKGNHVFLNPAQFPSANKSGFVKISGPLLTMISAYECSDKVSEGTIEVRSFTHGRTMQIANGDSVTVEEVLQNIPHVDYLEVYLGNKGVVKNPHITSPAYVSPGYFISCREGLCAVKKGQGLYSGPTDPISCSSDPFSQDPGFMDIVRAEAASSININFCQMGLGGLKSQMDRLIRQVLISRIIPSDMRERYQVKDAKGILLYGPPGTGKTSIARKIGKIIPDAVITNINGPELSSKYYGETEQRIREIFERDIGGKLHVIIFDEIDAVGKRRGAPGSSGIDDKVLTQLLTMIDGLGPDMNTLVIGITNRKDILDQALLRSGRLECQIEIPLPTESGRAEILDIYLDPIRKKGLAEGIDTKYLAIRLDGYSGADIEALINRAKNLALLRNCDMDDTCIKAKENTFEKITPEDIALTIEEFSPTFSKNDAVVQKYVSYYTTELIDPEKMGTIRESLEDIMLKPMVLGISDLVDSEKFVWRFVTEEERRVVACHAAHMINFPYIRYISYNDFLGMTSRECCEFLQGVYMDCLSSERAVLVLDNLEEVRDRSLILRQRFICEHPLDENRRIVIIRIADSREDM